MTDIQVFRAAWVLPVAGPPIRTGEVVVGRDGRIAAVGPRGAMSLPDSFIEHDLGEAILLPGLINTHAHPELAMFRGALEDLAFHDWILRLVGARRGVLDHEDSLAAARLTTYEALAAGITTIAATEASGAAARALHEAQMRGVVYQEVFGPDPRQVPDSMRQLITDLERISDIGDGERVTIGVSPHAPYTVSDALYAEVARFAREERLPIAVHIAESRAERDLVTRGEGNFAVGLRARGIATPIRARSPIALLDRLGVLDLRPLLIHCVDVNGPDIERIAAAGAPVAHCPIANARLGHGLAPVAELQAAGVTIGLGTDSVGSNNRLDLLEEARAASLLQRVALRSHSAMSAAELLRLCTIDGARALGLEDRVGTLEPGKEADLCAVGIGTPATVPLGDPVAALFHSARGSDVVMTVVQGKILHDRGTYAIGGMEEARRAVLEAGERLSRGS